MYRRVSRCKIAYNSRGHWCGVPRNMLRCNCGRIFKFKKTNIYVICLLFGRGSHLPIRLTFDECQKDCTNTQYFQFSSKHHHIYWYAIFFWFDRNDANLSRRNAVSRTRMRNKNVNAKSNESRLICQTRAREALLALCLHYMCFPCIGYMHTIQWNLTHFSLGYLRTYIHV